MKSILDPGFKYVPAASTDVRKTFARIKREMIKREMQKEAAKPKVPVLMFDRAKVK